MQRSKRRIDTGSSSADTAKGKLMASVWVSSCSTSVRRAAAAELLFGLIAAPKLWLLPLSEALLIPSVPVPVWTTILWPAQRAGGLITVVVWLALALTAALPASRSASIACPCALVGLVMLALADVNRVQPPMLHGAAMLAASFSGDPLTARVVTAGTWMWAGLHKLNPAFRDSSELVMIDPVIALSLGDRLSQRSRGLLRLLVAACEATMGGVLVVSATCLPAGFSRFRCVPVAITASIKGLATMHVVILVRLLQTGWNHHVIGWNIMCFYLTRRLFWGLRVETSGQRPQVAPAIFAMNALILVAPALVAFGQMDP